MNRKLIVLKMVVLALDERNTRDRQATTLQEFIELALAYGKGVDLEAYEVKEILDGPLHDLFGII